MDIQKTKERAGELLASGMRCSENVLKAIAEDAGIDSPIWEISAQTRRRLKTNSIFAVDSAILCPKHILNGPPVKRPTINNWKDKRCIQRHLSASACQLS